MEKLQRETFKQYRARVKREERIDKVLSAVAVLAGAVAFYLLLVFLLV
jgi:hypothetical protein